MSTTLKIVLHSVMRRTQHQEIPGIKSLLTCSSRVDEATNWQFFLDMNAKAGAVAGRGEKSPPSGLGSELRRGREKKKEDVRRQSIR